MLCVVIPTYNNHKTVEQVVRDVLRYTRDVIVVNDGSTDDTQQILDSLRSAFPSLDVVSYPTNRGKGYALKCGFRRAMERGFRYAITIDSDGQHYASDIPNIIRAHENNPGALVVGSRKLEGVDRSAGSSFANHFSNFWFALQTLHHVSDTQSGYRLYPLRPLALSFVTDRYEAELCLLVFAHWQGIPVVSTPIDVYYPPRAERVSHFRPGRDFLRISVLNTVLCLLAVVYGWPRTALRTAVRLGRSLHAALAFAVVYLLVVLPSLACLSLLVRDKQRLHRRVRRLIFWESRFFALRHGIPGVRFTVEREAEVDMRRPYVIVCNHQSHFDTTFQTIFTPSVVYLTNQWVWRSPILGPLVRNAGYIPVTDGIETILPRLKEITDEGVSIVVYPEGTRSPDNQVMRYRKGAFAIAEKLGLDILPMTLYGAGNVWRKGAVLLRSGQVVLHVGKPISQDELRRIGDPKAQARHLRALCRATLADLAKRYDKP